MQRLKNYIGIIVLILIAFTGCTKSEKIEGRSERPVIELEMISIQPQEDYSDIEKIINKFNENNTDNINICYKAYPMEEYKIVLARKMATGDVPDLFFSWSAGFLKPYVQSGKVMALNQVLKEDEEWLNQYKQEDFKTLTFNENIYGVPISKCLTVVYYDKQMFNQFNVKEPRTYEEFIEICEVFKKNGVVPLKLQNDPWYSGQLFFQIINSISEKKNLSVEKPSSIKWNEGKYIEAAKKLAQLNTNHYISDNFLEIEDYEIKEQWAMCLDGNWATSWLESSGNTYGVFVMPSMKEDNNTGAIGGIDRSFAIAESSENKEAAIKVLKALVEEENQRLMCYESKIIPIIDLELDVHEVGALYNEVYSLYKNISEFNLNIDVKFGMEFGNVFNEVAQAIIAGEDYMEQLDKLQSYAEKSK